MNATILSGVIGASVCLSSLHAQTYFDGEFRDSEWEAVAIQWRGVSTNRSGTWSVQQALTGGNPGAFQQFTVDNATNHLFVANLRKDAVWSPGSDGPVLAIYFGLDARQVEPVIYGIGFTAVIVQSGIYYVGESSYVPASDQWVARTHDWPVFGGEAGAWERTDGQAGQPDFSAAGQPIRCGYVASFIYGRYGATNSHSVAGLDNWTAYVEPAPGPRLTITRLADNRVLLAWPTNGFGYGLMAAPILPTGWAPNWTGVQQPVSVADGQFTVILPAGGNQQFYQLRKVCWVSGWCN